MFSFFSSDDDDEDADGSDVDLFVVVVVVVAVKEEEELGSTGDAFLPELELLPLVELRRCPFPVDIVTMYVATTIRYLFACFSCCLLPAWWWIVWFGLVWFCFVAPSGSLLVCSRQVIIFSRRRRFFSHYQYRQQFGFVRRLTSQTERKNFVPGDNNWITASPIG